MLLYKIVVLDRCSCMNKSGTRIDHPSRLFVWDIWRHLLGPLVHQKSYSIPVQNNSCIVGILEITPQSEYTQNSASLS